MEEIVEVPSYFLCPISLQMMKDPVTVTTGITYDRENIEKWIFSCKNATCPATNQELQSLDLIPNHTLRRLIQSWCKHNESNGYERIPTPKPAVEKSQIIKLINEAASSTTMQIKCLKNLRSIAYGGQSNKNNLKAAGIVTFLASLMKRNVNQDDGLSLAELALDILSQLDLSEVELKNLMWEDDGLILDSLMEILKCGDDHFRGFAMMLIASLYSVADPKYLMDVNFVFFLEVVNVLRDNLSMQVSKATLKFLVELCPWGRNRIKVVEAGAIWVLIDLLLNSNSNDKRQCELILVVLDQLCQCAEGRSELLKHGAGMAIVSKKILRVSHVATDRAVRVLSSISKYSANSIVLQEMLQVGVVAKLCLVLQVERGSKTKERATEILKLHSRIWKESSCISDQLLSSYP